MKNNKCISPKSFAATVILVIFFGFIGVHRFYVGKVGTGLLMIVFLIFFFPVTLVWTFVDLIMIVSSSFTDKWGRYIVTDSYKLASGYYDLHKDI